MAPRFRASASFSFASIVINMEKSVAFMSMCLSQVKFFLTQMILRKTKLKNAFLMPGAQLPDFQNNGTVDTVGDKRIEAYLMGAFEGWFSLRCSPLRPRG